MADFNLEKYKQTSQKWINRLIGIEDKSYNDLLKILQDEQDKIASMLSTALEMKEFPAWKKRELQVIESNIDKILKDVKAKGEKWVGKYLKKGMSHGVSQENQALRLFNPQKLVASFQDIPVRVIQLAFWDSLSWFEEVATEQTAKMRRIFMRGLTEGQSNQRISKALRNEKVVIDKVRADRIVRTQTNMYSNVAKVEVGKELGFRYYLWIAHIDKRTGDDSLIRNGKIGTLAEWNTHTFYYPNGERDKYKGIPPLRPNDRCSIVSVSKSWFQPLQWHQLRREFKKTEVKVA